MAYHACEDCFWYDGTATMLGAQCLGCAREKSAVNWTPKDERHYAKWVKATGMMPPEWHGRHICSFCKEFALRDFHYRESLSNYCPNCGAEMESEDK